MEAEEEYGGEFYTEDSDTECYDKFEIEALKVYCIYNKATKKIIYIGRTKRALKTRWREHRYNSASKPVKEYMLVNGGFDNYNIEVLKECDTISEFIDWESHLILEMNPPCNVQGIYRPPPKKNWGLIKNIMKRHQNHK
jgi:hypothetical protein